MKRQIQLVKVAQARSGDKADAANVALFAPNRRLYEAFKREVTSERVRHHFAGFVKGDVDRYEVPNVLALTFVLHRALDGGAANSLRSDALGKAFGSLLLRMTIDVDESEIDGVL